MRRHLREYCPPALIFSQLWHVYKNNHIPKPLLKAFLRSLCQRKITSRRSLVAPNLQLRLSTHSPARPFLAQSYPSTLFCTPFSARPSLRTSQWTTLGPVLLAACSHMHTLCMMLQLSAGEFFFSPVLTTPQKQRLYLSSQWLRSYLR